MYLIHLDSNINVTAMEFSQGLPLFNMNCTNFSLEEFEFINRCRGITGIICMMILLAVLLFLICSKAYSTVFQRLYMYLVVGKVLSEIVIALLIEHQWKYRGQETVCKWLGFFSLWTYYIIFILSYEIIGYILYLVISKMGVSPPPTKWMSTKCFRVFMELAYILMPVFVSTVFAVQAYASDSYGIAGPWCFVRSLAKDCKPRSFVVQVVFFITNVAVGAVSIAVSIFFLSIYLKFARSYKEVRHLLKQTLCVMIFQCILTFLAMFHFSVRLYTLITRRHQQYGLWVTFALTGPAGELILPLGILLNFYPVRKILHKIYERLIQLCCRYGTPANVVESITKEATTAPKSDRITQPSTTYFDVPHPDSESDMSTSDQSPLIKDNEDSSTISCFCWQS